MFKTEILIVITFFESLDKIVKNIYFFLFFSFLFFFVTFCLLLVFPDADFSADLLVLPGFYFVGHLNLKFWALYLLSNTFCSHLTEKALETVAPPVKNAAPLPDRQTDRQTDRHTDRQTQRQTDKFFDTICGGMWIFSFS